MFFSSIYFVFPQSGPRTNAANYDQTGTRVTFVHDSESSDWFQFLGVFGCGSEPYLVQFWFWFTSLSFCLFHKHHDTQKVLQKHLRCEVAKQSNKVLIRDYQYPRKYTSLKFTKPITNSHNKTFRISLKHLELPYESLWVEATIRWGRGQAMFKLNRVTDAEAEGLWRTNQENDLWTNDFFLLQGKEKGVLTNVMFLIFCCFFVVCLPSAQWTCGSKSFMADQQGWKAELHRPRTGKLSI